MLVVLLLLLLETVFTQNYLVTMKDGSVVEATVNVKNNGKSSEKIISDKSVKQHGNGEFYYGK